jgi:predicted metalloprotease
MNLFGRRESDNVDDRRGMGGGAKAGLGIGGMIVVAIITLLMGGNATDVLQNTGLMSGSTQTQQGTYQPTKEEEELAKFSKQILASTEDIWTAEFQRPIPHPNWSFTQGRYRQDAAMEMPRLGLSTARLTNASIWISLF